MERPGWVHAASMGRGGDLNKIATSLIKSGRSSGAIHYVQIPGINRTG